MIKTANWLEYNKYQENLRAISLASSQKRNITQRFMDYDDLEYLATVTIGTPPQEFNVILDTGSTDFWVPSINCKKSPCKEKKRFNPTKSSTYANMSGKWQIQYGTGNANGEFGKDTVRFGPKDNTFLTIPQVRIGEATEIASFFHDKPLDGILGFGFQSLSDYKYSPVFMEAYKKKLVDEPIFTVYYEKRGEQDGADGGQITFGGVDTDHCGEVAYKDLTHAAYWQFTVDRVQMGDSSHEGPFEVISDTGTSAIIGPLDLMSSMLQKISAQNLKGALVADCATKITFDITIGGKVYAIRPENYLLDLKVDDKCALAIGADYSMDSDGLAFILGAPFLRQFCNIHDMGNKRIGFATILGRASAGGKMILKCYLVTLILQTLLNFIF
ncbi:unnamed protein product, partial [Mesorhabditis belari]|uniref:Peptidase A1 domain-containing protein n=1 Tax=Mesorhabditis belari TaxID=2138241 RepID=A0AAF3FJK5_9BILA